MPFVDVTRGLPPCIWVLSDCDRDFSPQSHLLSGHLQKEKKNWLIPEFESCTSFDREEEKGVSTLTLGKGPQL